MTDALQPVLTFAKVKRQLQALGMTISFRRDTGEYRVNYRGQHEANAYYTNLLDDALATGIDMAAHANRIQG